MTVELEEGVELARLTTIGTGGPARAFARVRTVDALEAALAWARERDLPSVAVGLGSNVLAADAGVEALVLRLEGDLARGRRRGGAAASRAGVPRTPSACTGRAPPVSAGSSSRARSPGRRAAACG